MNRKNNLIIVGVSAGITEGISEEFFFGGTQKCVTVFECGNFFQSLRSYSKDLVLFPRPPLTELQKVLTRKQYAN